MVYLHIHVTDDDNVTTVKQTVADLIDKRCLELKELSRKRFLQNLKPDSVRWYSPAESLIDDADEHNVSPSEEKLSLLESDSNKCDRFDHPTASVITPRTYPDQTCSLYHVMDGLSNKEMLFDISRLARLSGLVFPLESLEPRYVGFLNLVQHEHLSASHVDWWERPYWAWSWNDMLLAEAARFATEISNHVQDIHMTVASDALLVRLPYLVATDTPSCMTVIHSENDTLYIQQALKCISKTKVDDRLITALNGKYLGRPETYPLEDITQFLHAMQNAVEPTTNHSVATIDTENMIEIVKQTAKPNSMRKLNEISENCELKSAVSSSDSQNSRVVNPYTNSNNYMGSTQMINTINQMCSTGIDSSHGPIPVSKVVTPEISRLTGSRSMSVEEQQQLPRSPQIDSQGIDLTVLSQLPLAFRSEARLAHLVGTESTGFLHRKRGPLLKWMVDASSGQQNSRIHLSSETRDTQRKRRKVGIEAFFLSSRANGR